LASLFTKAGTCQHCGMPITIARHHYFRVDCLFGCVRNFVAPCCRWCWRHSSTEERLNLAGCNYGYLLSRGVEVERDDWKQIRDTVLCDGLDDWDEIERIVGTPA